MHLKGGVGPWLPIRTKSLPKPNCTPAPENLISVQASHRGGVDWWLPRRGPGGALNSCSGGRLGMRLKGRPKERWDIPDANAHNQSVRINNGIAELNITVALIVGVQTD